MTLVIEGGKIMQSFDEMIRKFFDKSDLPNPFDPERFGRFLQEQIKNALPKDPNTLNQDGLETTGMNNTTQRFNQYSMPPHFDRFHIPTHKGATTGLNRAPIPQPIQTPSTQQPNQELNYQAFETHNELIVRVQIPEDPKFKPKNIKLTSYQLNFDNGEQGEPLLQIQLPKAVDPEETKCGFREGILEVKLAKRAFELIKEIDISNVYNTPGKRQ